MFGSSWLGVAIGATMSCWVVGSALAGTDFLVLKGSSGGTEVAASPVCGSHGWPEAGVGGTEGWPYASVLDEDHQDAEGGRFLANGEAGVDSFKQRVICLLEGAVISSFVGGGVKDEADVLADVAEEGDVLGYCHVAESSLKDVPLEEDELPPSATEVNVVGAAPSLLLHHTSHVGGGSSGGDLLNTSSGLGVLGIYLLALIVAAFVAKVLLCPTRIHVYKKDAAKASRSLRGGSALSGLARVALLIAFSGFAQCQFAPNWDIQPTQAVLEWVPTEDCPTLLDYLAADLGTTVQRPTAEQYARITGGCAILTFCNRDGGDYNDGLYGYKMGAPNDATADCLSPGPMIPVEAGHTYALIFCVVPDQEDDHPGSNIHTHGAHISGNGNSDDVTREVRAGSCQYYEYAFPEYHMGGTNWYHPHPHFHTEEQVEGAAVGFLINADLSQDMTVDPSKGRNKERQDVYEFLTNQDHQLYLLAAFDEDSSVWVNANQEGTNAYDLVAGKWYRMRIMTASAGGEPEIVKVSPDCDAYALAHDGVYRFEPPKAREEQYWLNGASRIDLALKCDSAGEYGITITDGFWGRNSAWDGVGWKGAQVIAVLNVVAGDASGPGPFLPGGEPWVSYRPNYLQNNTGDPDNRFVAEVSNNRMNDQRYNEDSPLCNTDGRNYFQYESLQEWEHVTIDIHPFHVHVWHQQVWDDNCGLGHDRGEYYDTIADGAANSESCLVRFRTVEYRGRTIMHCHILQHEDAGAMGWMNVQDGNECDPDPTPSEPCCLVGECSACVDENAIRGAVCGIGYNNNVPAPAPEDLCPAPEGLLPGDESETAVICSQFNEKKKKCRGACEWDDDSETCVESSSSSSDQALFSKVDAEDPVKMKSSSDRAAGLKISKLLVGIFIMLWMN